jgi:2-isopropylmalate synthase
MRKLLVYDTTLREGAQGAGASFSVEDKVRIARLLGELGVDYIEAGNPGSNPKDAALYRRMRGETLGGARLAAFGATCRVGRRADEDDGVSALLNAETPVVTIFGKAWDLHVTNVLGAELSQNLDMIRDTVSYLKREGREVCFDAEHFFDGMKRNEEYALAVLSAAREAGADHLALCDTNGGCFPHEIAEMTRKAVAIHGDCVGIHAHDDTGVAEANTIAAVIEGARMVQVTANGMGERCGNADLFVSVPNLQLKLGYQCLPQDRLVKLRDTSVKISELGNRKPNPSRPYVGQNAFAHKAGMHIDGVQKSPESFEHVPPESVGNERTYLLSEISGRSAVLAKIKRFFPQIDKGVPGLAAIVERIKEQEYGGYQYEGADASFELLVRRILSPYPPFFRLHDFKVIVIEPAPEDHVATAMIEVSVEEQSETTAEKGNGPVNALDKAARKALERFYPRLREMALTDYKVRVLDSSDATASRVRVLIESCDETDRWTTVGVSGDVIGASWVALTDSLEYKLLKDQFAKGET